jgi:hypothetical protein
VRLIAFAEASQSAWLACGPLPPFVVACFLDVSARRGRRCPARAHAVAVDAARPLHCAARSGVAPQNSLRSLRELRSDNRGESHVEARTARAPTPALRCSSPPKSPPPGNACREAQGYGCALQKTPRCLQRRERPGRRGRQEASAEQRSAAGSARLRAKPACLRPGTQGRVCGLAPRSEQRRAPPTESGARLQPSPAWPLSPLPLQRSRNLERAQRTTVKGREQSSRAESGATHRESPLVHATEPLT